MSFRRLMHYPPSASLANVIAQHSRLEEAAHVAKQIGDYFETLEGMAHQLRVLGPSPAPLARIQGRYRIQFLLKAQSRARLNGILRRMMDYCEERKIPPQSVMID